MPAWPTGVPFLNDASAMARSGPINNLIRTPMGIGPDKVRRRTSASVRSRSGRLAKLTKAQLATFETFYATDLAGGALSFTATDPFDCAEHTFRFVDGYQLGRSGAYYTLEATLEILP